MLILSSVEERDAQCGKVTLLENTTDLVVIFFQPKVLTRHITMMIENRGNGKRVEDKRKSKDIKQKKTLQKAWIT